MGRNKPPETRRVKTIWDRLWGIPLIMLGPLFVLLGLHQYQVEMSYRSQYTIKSTALVLSCEPAEGTDDHKMKYWHTVEYYYDGDYRWGRDKNEYQVPLPVGHYTSCWINPVDEKDLFLPEAYVLPEFVLGFYGGMGLILMIMGSFELLYVHPREGDGNMIEEIGPAIVRTILGTYDPDYRYELETTDEGYRIIITNRESGLSNTMELHDTPRDEEDDGRKPLLVDPEPLPPKHSPLFYASEVLVATLMIAFVMLCLKAGGVF